MRTGRKGKEGRKEGKEGKEGKERKVARKDANPKIDPGPNRSQNYQPASKRPQATLPFLF